MRVLLEGQQIKHEQYGVGVVTRSDSDRTAVEFDDHGEKLFVTSMMSAELIGDAPVPIPRKRRSKKPAVARVAPGVLKQ